MRLLDVHASSATGIRPGMFCLQYLKSAATLDKRENAAVSHLKIVLKPLSLGCSGYSNAVSKGIAFDDLVLECWTKAVKYVEQLLGFDLGEWLVRNRNPANELVVEDVDIERLE